LPPPQHHTHTDTYHPPTTPTEEILADIYAQVLGLDHAGIHDSFFELGGDSILAMQVVARARAAGLTCRPRDVFIEQTVARLARVAVAAGAVADGDDGHGDCPATPIMHWLNGIGGPVDQFNQAVLLQAPTGVGELDVTALLQALADHHPVLRSRIDADGSLRVPPAGSASVRDCVEVADGLTDEALVRARSRLDPTAGAMVSALWLSGSGQLVLMIHHLAVDGVSWRILLEDINIAWAQYHRGQEVALPATGTSFRRWANLLQECASSDAVVGQAGAWRRVSAIPAALPPPGPGDSLATAGRLSVSVDTETTRLLLTDVPAAFHAGVQDILLIAFGLAWVEFTGDGDSPVCVDVESHGRNEDLAPGVDLSRTVGWFTAKYPVSLAAGRLSWPQVVAGHASLGAAVKDVKEQLRALPDGLTYGLLRYLNDDADLPPSDPAIGFNYLGRLGAPAQTSSDGTAWRIARWGSLFTDATAALPISVMHTVELNAATIDTDAGPRLHAEWIWAASVLDSDQIAELSARWCEALTGICAHVRNGGGGLTPSDVAPARLGQREIDGLQQLDAIADILPLTALQQGLLFHAGTADGDDDLYAVQLDIALAGRLDVARLRDAVQTVIGRHPNVQARFYPQFEQPVQVIPVDPVLPWRYVELDGDDTIDHECAAERAAVRDLPAQPAFRVMLVRTATDRYRFVVTNHHIVLDGWSMPILLHEIFAAYHGHRLPTTVPYRRFLTWLAGRDHDAARTAWKAVFTGFDVPTLLARPDRAGKGPRSTSSIRLSESETRNIGELARSSHTTVNVVLQAAWAQVLMSTSGQFDVAFGTTVSGRPAEVAGAESMVGLFVNTVPVRAAVTVTTTSTELLERLQSDHNRTVEHQHVSLGEIHRLTGHEQLFDTLLVYENYPIDPAALAPDQDLVVTGVATHERAHYPLVVQVSPGPELAIRVHFRTDLFDRADIDALAARLRRVLAAMAADPAARLSALDLLDDGERTRLDTWSKRDALALPAPTAESIPQALATQVMRTPDAVALVDGDRSLTYREFDKASNRLAHQLSDRGIGPGTSVALLFARGAEAIVAMAAVLKTGAAYVP
ncbi:AMP-binding protein, partial [Mycobacterium sp. Y57]|uniref:condensation domain-containing protein n=1 Tax=Mycolicibacterium xanthum TaxID=2796469 RepID=UPI001C85C86E